MCLFPTPLQCQYLEYIGFIDTYSTELKKITTNFSYLLNDSIFHLQKKYVTITVLMNTLEYSK